MNCFFSRLNQMEPYFLKTKFQYKIQSNQIVKTMYLTQTNHIKLIRTNIFIVTTPIIKQSTVMEINQQTYQKNHSFSKTPSIAQVASWFVFLSKILVFYIYVLNEYQSNALKISMTVLFTGSLVGLICFAVYTGQLDPTDQLIKNYRTKNIEKYFCRKARIIEYKNEGKKIMFCNECKSMVKEDSKHCRKCESCSQCFDHHCMWLNICIGGKNYRSFAYTMAFTFFTLFFFLLSIGLLTEEKRMIDGSMSSFGFVIMWVVGFIDVVFALLILNLIILHIYLNYKGLSTYQFILLRNKQQKREQQEEQKRKQEHQEKQKRQKNQIQNSDKTHSILIQLSSQQRIDKQIDEGHCSDQASQHNQNKQIKDELKSSQNLQIIKERQSKIGISESEFSVTKNIEKKYLNEARSSEKNQSQIPSKYRYKKDISRVMLFQQGDKNCSDIRQTQMQTSSNARNRYYIKDAQPKIKINKFFKPRKNISLDIILSGNVECIEPHQDIVKNIELDQQIQNYRRHFSLNYDFNKKINKTSQETRNLFGSRGYRTKVSDFIRHEQKQSTEEKQITSEKKTTKKNKTQNKK